MALAYIGIPPGVLGVSVTVSIRVRRELIELADKTVRYGIARSRSHTFNIMVERGCVRLLGGGVLGEYIQEG